MKTYQWKRFVVYVRNSLKPILSDEEFTKEHMERSARDMSSEVLMYDIETRFRMLDIIRRKVLEESIKERDEMKATLNQYERVLSENYFK